MSKHAPADDTLAIHTLSSLQTALGDATPEEVRAQVEGHPDAALAHDGARVATPRVSKDAARMYGEALDFLARATEAQLDHVPMFSRDWLRVAVWAAAEGQRRYEALQAGKTKSATEQQVHDVEAEAALAPVEARRGQLHVALGVVAAGNNTLEVQRLAAYGTAADPVAAVHAQIALARAWRADGSKSVKDRLKKSRLDDAWLAAADKLATSAGTADGKAGGTRAKAAVTDADVNWLDGANIVLLTSAAAQFEAGHAADPSVPRLTFNALRSHVHRSHHAAPTTSPADGSTEKKTT